MQSALGADCAVTAVVGEERAACNEEKQGSYLAGINQRIAVQRERAGSHVPLYP
jgi:hypothetical protein